MQDKTRMPVNVNVNVNVSCQWNSFFLFLFFDTSIKQQLLNYIVSRCSSGLEMSWNYPIFI